ncbi:PTS sugar transporter subunit IIA [Lactovum odontotermitis]
MFGFGKNEKVLMDDKALYAPISGKIFKIEDCSDYVFSQKIIGDGFAIEPTDGKIAAPVSGTVTLAQGHAVGLTRADGLEVLLHIGVDTVTLNGSPYQLTVKVDDVVDGGAEIGRVDLAEIEAAGFEKTAMIVFTNTADKLADFTVNYGEAAAAEKIGQANVK